MTTPALTTSKGGPNPSSGQMPNCVVGIVKDNVDPNEGGRIKVEFPSLGAQSFWIRQASPNAGKERGLYALPEVEDEVLVVFMMGDISQGVIVGQFWNGPDKPPTEAKDGLPGPGKTDTGAKWSTDQFTDGSKDLSANDRRLWRSRSGHLFVFDDTSGAETVQIWDKNHELAFVFDSTENRILLTNSKGDIHIRTKNDLYLEAGKNIKWIAGEEIKGESGKDTIHDSKMNWKLTAKQNIETTSDMDTKMTAKMNFTATANINFKVEGKANLNAKGGVMATFEGGATAIVKGAMVMIN